MSNLSHVITAKEKDLGGFNVRRLLPQSKKRMVGPFIFLDHMGPATFDDHHKMTVSPHPHIGLSTLTYLFKGQVHHRDSLGVSLVISPGDVNWMTAGSGISHSERSPESSHNILPYEMHGLQFWVALPNELEDMSPSFNHYGVSQIPKIEDKNSVVDVVVGEYLGQVSPVKTHSPVVFMNIVSKNENEFKYFSDKNEVGIYLVSGRLAYGGQVYENNELLVFDVHSEINLNLFENTHFVIVGGAPLNQEKHIWWNFVSSSQEKIRNAIVNWNSGNFPMVPHESGKLMAPEMTHNIHIK